MANIFSVFPQECLAQLYFHEGKPTSNVCNNYFSFSDRDAVKSVFLRWIKGHIYRDEDFGLYSHVFFETTAYKIGKKKNPITYFCRDVIWKLSTVLNKKLLGWIRGFDPDYIFFASGDYTFPYRIALKISKKLKIPLTTCFFDDYYFFFSKDSSFLGKKYHKKLKKNIQRIIAQSNVIFTVSDLMNKEYSTYFAKKAYSLFTPFPLMNSCVGFENKKDLTYIGGLGLGRCDALLEIGNKLREYKGQKISRLNIYSQESDPLILKKLSNCETICFKGLCGSDEVASIIDSSFAVIHVESFDEQLQKRTRLSLSTKIGEYLASSSLIVAYGPTELASIEYLKDNKAAIASDNIEYILMELYKCETDHNHYNNYLNASSLLAKTNHSKERVQSCLLDAFTNK